MQLLLLGQRLDGAVVQKLTQDRHRLSERTAKLEALSPLGILSRGYSVASDTSGKVISSVEDTKVGEHFSLRLMDGTILGTVEQLRRNGE